MKVYFVNKWFFVSILILITFYLSNLIFNNLETPGFLDVILFCNIFIGNFLIIYFVSIVLKRYTLSNFTYSLLLPFLIGFWWTYYVNPFLFAFYLDYDFTFRVGYDYSNQKMLTTLNTIRIVLYANIGLLFFILGFFVSKAKKSNSSYSRFTYNKYIVIFLGVISFLSVAIYVKQFGGLAFYISNIMAIRTGEFSGEIQNPLLRHMMLSFQVFVLSYTIYTVSKNRKVSFSILGLITLSTLVLALSGGRGAIITSWLTILFVISIYIGISRKSVVLISVLIFFIMFSYRTILFSLQEDLDLSNNFSFSVLETINSIFLKNYNFEQSLLIFSDYRNNIPLLLFGPLKDTVLTFWPESLIPIGKYDEPRFTYLITELLSARNVKDTMTPGLLGLFYLMFRELGIVFGMFLFGFILKKTIYIISYIKKDHLLLLLYSLLYFTMIGFASSGSIEAAVKSYLIKVSLFLLLAPLIYKKKFTSH